ncbi:MAG: M56 family metallopeptidase [Bacteroidota bacterium]
MTVLMLALKGALVLSLAGSAVHLLRRVPASARHAVWVAAFVALLALPLFATFGPTLDVAVLPQTATEAAIPAAPAPPPALTLAPPAVPAPPQPPTMPASVPSPPAPPALAQASPPPSGLLATVSQIRLSQWLLTVWAGGVALVLLGWALPLLAAMHLVRTARPETSNTWLDALELARLLSAVEGPVRLLRSDRLDVPVAWGWGTPAVVLPADADDWDDDRRQAVLLHELAHLARQDAKTQALAQIAVALHWFDPLAWWGYRQMLAEREHACDDAVLRGGTRPSAYAGHLVEIARSLRRRPRALAGFAPMARTSQLEGRVRSILGDRQRGALSRLRVAGVMALALALTLPLAACQLTSRTTDTTTSQSTAEAAAALAEAEAAHASAQHELERAARQVAEAEAERARLGAESWEAELERIDLDGELERALEEARDALAEVRLHPEDVDWDDIEAEMAAAEADMEAAFANARDVLAETDWQRDAEIALRRAREEMARAQGELERELADVRETQDQALQRAIELEMERERLREGRLREAHRERLRLREGRLRESDAARKQEEARRELEQARIRAEEARIRTDEARRRAERERRDETSVRLGPSAPPAVQVRFTQPNGASAGAWAESLAGWRNGLEALTAQLASVESEGHIVALRGALDGMAHGLEGLESSGRGWAVSSTEHRIVSESLSDARAALALAEENLHKAEACEETR